MEPRPLDLEHDLGRLRTAHAEAFGDNRFVADESSDDAFDEDLVFGIDDSDGRLIAYIYATLPSQEYVHVWELAVIPEFQRKGLGRSLLRHLAALCSAHGIPEITATPPRSDPRLTAYLDRCGFRTVDPLEAMQATPQAVLAALAAE